MMNTPLSSTGQLARYFLAGPLVAAAALAYSAAHARRPELAVPAATSLAAPASYPATGQAASLKNKPAAKPGFARLLPAVAARLPARAVPTLPAARRPAPAPAGVAAAQPQPARPAQGGPVPLYYVDGKLVTATDLNLIKPADIVNVQVLKGEAARQLAGDKGGNGVVVITTKANQDSPAVAEFNKKLQRLTPTPAAVSGQPALGNSLPADALYYLDGQPSTKQFIEQLDPKAIASVDVVKDRPADVRRLFNSPASSAIIVTTRANADAPAVQGFIQKADLPSGYTARLIGVNALVPSVLAYITSHYPNARLNEVTELTQKTTGTVKFRVQLINGKRPFYIYFTPQGEFLGE